TPASESHERIRLTLHVGYARMLDFLSLSGVEIRIIPLAAVTLAYRRRMDYGESRTSRNTETRRREMESMAKSQSGNICRPQRCQSSRGKSSWGRPPWRRCPRSRYHPG